ncbi:MAG TPA: hypothetical protein VFV08_08965, partial [Puia sp.]|nr:hypothetical protein [Puia sp.]
MNKKIQTNSIISNEPGAGSRTGVFMKIIPVLAISIFLAYYLKIDLVIVSGLMFCYYLFESEKEILPGQFKFRIQSYFLLSIVVTVGSKALSFGKDIFLHHTGIHEAMSKQIDLYKVCFLSASYQSFGFMKRGLIPTIVQSISGDYVFQVFFVQCLGYFLFVLGAFLLCFDKLVSFKERKTFALILLFAPIGMFAFFNFNLGFYDMTILGLLLISFHFRNSRLVYLVDMLGMFVHEAYLFLKLPLLILQFITQKKGSGSRAQLIAQSAFNLAIFAAIIFWPRPSLEHLWQNYSLLYPDIVTRTTPGDTEAFFPLSNAGSLHLQLKIIWNYLLASKGISYYVPIPAMILSVVVCSFATSNLQGKERILDLVMTCFVFLFPLLLCIVGGDFGRWLAFSYVLWTSYYLLMRPLFFPEAEISFSGIYAILLVALIFTPFGVNFSP